VGYPDPPEEDEMPDHNYPCPDCGAYEDKDCRCTGADYDRFVWGPGEVAAVAAERSRDPEKVMKDLRDDADPQRVLVEPTGGSLPDPLALLEGRLQEMADDQGLLVEEANKRTSAATYHSGCQTGIRMALHAVREARDEQAAIQAQMAGDPPGRVY